jgi:sporulation protein YlmC with PRC-barrel domain
MQTTSLTQNNSNSQLIDSNRVEGTEVYDRSGKHIGSVKRLVIDKVSGRVVYTVVSFGGFLGMGGDTYTVPWSALSYDTTLGGYATNITPQQLKDAPADSRNRDEDQRWSDRVAEASLYDHYGSPYYWSE